MSRATLDLQWNKVVMPKSLSRKLQLLYETYGNATAKLAVQESIGCYTQAAVHKVGVKNLANLAALDGTRKGRRPDIVTNFVCSAIARV